jgi:hypothetical protein
LVLIHLSAAGSCNHGVVSGPQIKDDKSVQGAARVILAWHLKGVEKKITVPSYHPELNFSRNAGLF